MNDLISRQAAIDMLIAGEPYGIEYNINKIRELPPAQPEIIRCKDCRHADECHKSVQYTRNEPNMTTIGYSPIEWCSSGERREKADVD